MIVAPQAVNLARGGAADHNILWPDEPSPCACCPTMSASEVAHGAQAQCSATTRLGERCKSYTYQVKAVGPHLCATHAGQAER